MSSARGLPSASPCSVVDGLASAMQAANSQCGSKAQVAVKIEAAMLKCYGSSDDPGYKKKARALLFNLRINGELTLRLFERKMTPEALLGMPKRTLGPPAGNPRDPRETPASGCGVSYGANKDKADLQLAKLAQEAHRASSFADLGCQRQAKAPACCVKPGQSPMPDRARGQGEPTER